MLYKKFFLSDFDLIIFGNMPAYFLMIPWCILLAFVVFFTTSTHHIPKYHFLFYLLSTIGTIFTMFIISDYITKIMLLISIVTKLSSAFIDCTFTAFGNALGPLMSNIQFSLDGYQRMALGSCFGGPIFCKY